MKIMEPEPSSLPTVHENPQWMSNLKKNFFRDVVEPCFIRTKTAVVNNEDVKVEINCIKNKAKIFSSEFEGAFRHQDGASQVHL